jgi:TonB family protein
VDNAEAHTAARDDTEPGITEDTNSEIDDADGSVAKTESMFGKTPFLIFAIIVIATLANIAYLQLWNGEIAENEPTETPTVTSSSDAGEIAKELVSSIKSAGQKIIEITANLPLPGSGVGGSEIEVVSTSGKNASVAQLLDRGRISESELRLFEPPENNALFYFEQALQIDRANVTAKKGRTRVLSALEAGISGELNKQQYLQADELLKRFRFSHPQHSKYPYFLEIVKAGLERELARLRNNPESDVGAAIELLYTLDSEYSSIRDSLLQLQKERKILAKLDRAIADGFLLPPDRRNVYEQILQLREDRSVSAEELDDRAFEVSGRLYRRAETFIANNDLAKARKIITAMKTLNVDQGGIRQLNRLLDQIGKPPPANAASDSQSGQANLEQSNLVMGAKNLITEAKVLNRVDPQYPREARDRGIEGWVRLNFLIDETGQLQNLSVVGEDPAGVFTDVSIAAVRQWEFQPAHDQVTRVDIVANFSIKLYFTLPN